MAVRQYIGMRYVPVYYQNSQDPTSSEWEANVNYEPLTIVSLPNMHSYQSKKFVPASVGSPASNPEYWYDQGYASAYVQALQDQIDDMKDGNVPGSLQDQINDNTSDITALKKNPTNHKYILVGDSFSCGIRGGGQSWVTGWADYAEQVIGSDNVFRYDPAGDQSFEGVSAFTSVSDKNFIGQINYVYNNKLGTTAPESITEIVVLGGTNELTNLTSENIASAIDDFCARAKTLFPNAQIKIGCIGLDARTMLKKNVYSGYILGAQRNGAGFIKELFNLGTKKTYDSGYGHWTEPGYNYYNPIILESIIHGTCKFEWTDAIPLTVNTNEVAIARGSTITYELLIRCSDKGISCRVVDSFRGRGWDLTSVKAYSGAGTYTVQPFTFTGNFYPAILNNQPVDITMAIYNINNHTFDTASAEMTITLDLSGSPTSHGFNMSAFPSAIYDNVNQIAWTWNGSKYQELLITS